MSEERTIPQDLPAEQGVLGGVLVHGQAVLDQIMEIVKPGDFYDRRHGEIYKAMLALHKHNRPVDEITVHSQLETSGNLDLIGGALYLARLADMIPTQDYTAAYAKLVREKAWAREILATLSACQEKVFQNLTDVAEAAGEVESLVFKSTQSRADDGPAKMSDSVVETIQAMTSKEAPCWGTGILPLDNKLGGLFAGDLNVLAARPGCGKTSLAQQIAKNFASAGLPALIFSLEMTKKDLTIRYLAMEAKISNTAIRRRRLSPEEWERLSKAADVVAEWPIYIDDTFDLTMPSLRSKALRTAAQLYRPLRLVVVDYLQLMKGSGKRRDTNRNEELGDITRGLKGLAKELNCPVLLLSQLNRQVENREDGRPRPSDLRDSGAIEQDADSIWFITRPDKGGNCRLIIEKARNDGRGEIELIFNGPLTRFEIPGAKEFFKK